MSLRPSMHHKHSLWIKVSRPLHIFYWLKHTSQSQERRTILSHRTALKSFCSSRDCIGRNGLEKAPFTSSDKIRYLRSVRGRRLWKCYRLFSFRIPSLNFKEFGFAFSPTAQTYTFLLLVNWSISFHNASYLHSTLWCRCFFKFCLKSCIFMRLQGDFWTLRGPWLIDQNWRTTRH